MIDTSAPPAHMPAGLERTTLVPHIPPAPFAPDCASLRLLDEPWPLSQVAPLNAKSFAEAANQRRIRIADDRDVDENALEELHRTGLLVPLFEVDRSYTPCTSLRDTQSAAPGEPRSSTTHLLRNAYASDYLVDAAAVPFEPWSQSGREVYYSHHQLLGLAYAAPFLAIFERYVDSSWTVYWYLPDDARNACAVDAALSWRSFATALTHLDTVYLPQVTRQLRGEPAAWRKHRETRDARAALRWFGDGLTAERIHQAVAGLRIDAAHVDDLGDFYDLVRRSGGKAWASLRGGTRRAMDLRIAAEMLELCATDAGLPPPELPPFTYPLEHQGLRNREQSLDAALTELRLSPYPSVVLAVEGETEELLAPRVAAQLGLDLTRDWITLDCFGGVDKDLTSLARYAATPVLGRDIGDGVLLDRPVTRFVVLVDAEVNYKTEQLREKQRIKLLKEIAKQLPYDLRPDILAEKAFHVEIHTWGRFPFEFAHFDDDQLAEGLEIAAGAPHPLHDRAALVDAVRRERHRREPNIEHAWTGEGPNKINGGPKKVQIAEALWPTLERKIARALRTGRDNPPIMDGVLRAAQLALMTPRSHVMLRRHR